MGRKSNRKSSRKKRNHYIHRKKEINSSLQKKPRFKFINFLRDAAGIVYLVTWIAIFVSLDDSDISSGSFKGFLFIIALLIAIALYILLFKELWPDRGNNTSQKRKKGSSYDSSGFINDSHSHSDTDCSSSSDGGGDCGGGGD
ncbi:hypothetical protein [Bacillus cereus group sp. BfR-BA-01380]|uniref:hypothetical protein n=1 Tax=Bacillus cereus group sp. BfR-BA-01380 TaxID=2920324 RepID=UPI001F593457|nr:hypothetical protein [Bacillus cereus group sp. BfR-BA-01380]